MLDTTLAFDVYGTLIDTNGVDTALDKMLATASDRVSTALFSRTWREKQLEYSFRRGLMQQYESFAVCTSQALEYTSRFFDVPLSDSQKKDLLETYRELPAFDDVPEGLDRVRDAGFRSFAFSNGSREAVEHLLITAGIRDSFDGVVSTEDLRSFKPNPAVYCHFLRESGAAGGDAWMISGNPFDVLGALSSGMKAAWVRRTPDKVFDPWGQEPTITVDGLASLAGEIKQTE